MPGVSPKIDRWLASARPPRLASSSIWTLSARSIGARRDCPFADIFYAVKANPAPAVISDLGCARARASTWRAPGEIERCRELGITQGALLVRKHDKARAGYRACGSGLGDRPLRLRQRRRNSKSCRPYRAGRPRLLPLAVSRARDRMAAERANSAARAEMAIELLLRARRLGLRPVGVSFHVGSQQTDPAAMGARHRHGAAGVFRACARAGLDLELVESRRRPARRITARRSVRLRPMPSDRECALRRKLRRVPTAHHHRARALYGRRCRPAARAVLLIAAKSRHAPRIAGCISMPAATTGCPRHWASASSTVSARPATAAPSGPVILAGPTCDSTDIIYERADYRTAARSGDRRHVDFLSAGAYTASYASVEFNGFAPIQTYCI